MKLNELKPTGGARKKRKRVGRGIASDHGTTRSALVEMKAILYRDDLGSQIDVVEIPEALRSEAAKHREQMVSAVAEADDGLTHKYLAGEELTTAEIRHGLRLGTLQSKFVPVLTGSALKNKGIQPMLDAVTQFLPSPLGG